METAAINNPSYKPIAAYKLTDYQQLMRLFAANEPYNAVHFIELSPQIKPECIQNNIQKVIKNLGIGSPKFANDIVSFIPTSAKALSLKRSSDSLACHLTHELNYTFKQHDFPLRFYLCSELKTDKVYFSITYNHWVADAYAIAQFILNITTAAQDCSLSPQQLPIKTKSQQHLIKQKYWWSFSRLFFNSLTFAKAYRPLQTTPSQNKTLATFHLFEPHTLAKLKKISKQHLVTINDIFIVALAKIFGELSLTERNQVKKKWYKAKRSQIIISVICNLRPYQPSSLKLFNLMLGFFNISFKEPEKQSLSALLKYTNKVSQKSKNKQLFIKNTALFKIQRYFYNRTDDKYRLFLKNSPITVDISNLNLNHIKTSNTSGCYLRFSPASAICPVVLNVTTLNNKIALTLTCSNKRYDADALANIKHQLVTFIDNIDH